MVSEPVSRPPAPTDQAELLRQALRQTRWNLGLVSLMLVALIGAGVYVYFFAGRLLKAKEEKLLAAAKEQLATHSEKLTEEAGNLVSETFPPVAQAFGAQLQEDLPVYVQAFNQQGNQLADHLEAALKNKVQKRYDAYLARYRSVLKEEFPEVTDQLTLDRMNAALQRAANRMAQHYYVNEFRDQVAQLTRLWQEIPPLPSDKSRGKNLEQMLVNDLTQWLVLQISEGGSPLSLGQGPAGPRRVQAARAGKGE